MLKLFLVLGIFMVTSCLNKCYHQKCEIKRGEYTTCDQKEYKCSDWDSFFDPGCTYKGSGSVGGYVLCFSSEKCTTDSFTGQAECVDDGDYDIDDGISLATIIGITVGCIVLFITITCCVCACAGKACFKGRSRNRGRVIRTQPVTVGKPMHTGVPMHTGSSQPPPQYPPPQYPPGGGYPGSQPVPAQLQYPPVSGHPATGPVGASQPLPPSADAYPHPGGISDAPPPYQQPAQNPYYRG